MKQRIIISFIFILLISSCKSVDITYIKKRMWLWDKGYRIDGDALFFDEPMDNPIYDIREPNIILYKGKPNAKIISVDKLLNKIVIVSISTKEKGTYIDSGEFTK